MDLAGAAGIGTDPELYALKEAGRRMSGVLNQAIVDNGLAATGRWLAFRLDDGGSPDHGTIYDSRPDAMRRNWLTPCHFEQLRPMSYGPDECAMTLHYARAMWSAGQGRDPDAPAPIMPVRREVARSHIRKMQARANRTRARSRYSRR